MSEYLPIIGHCKAVFEYYLEIQVYKNAFIKKFETNERALYRAFFEAMPSCYKPKVNSQDEVKVWDGVAMFLKLS